MKIISVLLCFFSSLAINATGPKIEAQTIDDQVEEWILEILPERRLELYLQQIEVKKARKKARAKILKGLNAIDRNACKAFNRMQGQEDVENRLRADVENKINQLLRANNLLSS